MNTDIRASERKRILMSVRSDAFEIGGIPTFSDVALIIWTGEQGFETGISLWALCL
jgi:hypothetical protein